MSLPYYWVITLQGVHLLGSTLQEEEEGLLKEEGTLAAVDDSVGEVYEYEGGGEEGKVRGEVVRRGRMCTRSEGKRRSYSSSSRERGEKGSSNSGLIGLGTGAREKGRKGKLTFMNNTPVISEY